MAANLTSGDAQSYDPGHGIRLMRGVAPDVVLLQEFNYALNGEDDIRAMVDRVGPSYHYYREEGAQIANGIISRWPIIESGEWDDPQTSTRDFAWARIDIPGPRDLWAVSVHLLTASSSVRQEQANTLIGRIRATVPESDYLVIGGDLNTDSRGEPCFSVLSQVVVTSSPYPADKSGNTNTSHPRSKPYDHVLVDGDLRKYQKATVIGSNTFAGGLVLDSRVYTPLTDISPVESGDSDATNMQHMGVVKDFRVPLF
ncbi:endonuclease/exonuclease/phosphatase family protein [Archangium violaceum]|uniref:endonuclease/exonuclease/phosphatase family protein n=1 Tax=Archangium violaceum TaxID=83451 RepID=UPI0019526CFC|nr:endonuclease/exonuclease/phosphatase family protein [Archangium violaceum]